MSETLGVVDFGYSMEGTSGGEANKRVSTALVQSVHDILSGSSPHNPLTLGTFTLARG
jgi:hypothetical protein